jgi:hypothetical protein
VKSSAEPDEPFNITYRTSTTPRAVFQLHKFSDAVARPTGRENMGILHVNPDKPD